METEIKQTADIINTPENVQSKKSWLKSGWNKEVVKDINAPEYYSKSAVYGFSFFFSALAGSILLAVNIKKSGNKKGIAPVVLFGIAYSILTIFIGSRLPNTDGMPELSGILGAIILNNYFWKKYLGQIKYRKRSIWMPLVICLLISIILILLIIKGHP